MSHYSLAVFTEEKLCEILLSNILAPFEESPHNTRSKWNRWRIGGRYHGSLILKPNASDFILCDPSPSIQRSGYPYVDGAQIKDIDTKSMLSKAQPIRAEEWDCAEKILRSGEKLNPFTVDISTVQKEKYIEDATMFIPNA